jgi:hypothetical protein
VTPSRSSSSRSSTTRGRSGGWLVDRLDCDLESACTPSVTLESSYVAANSWDPLYVSHWWYVHTTEQDHAVTCSHVPPPATQVVPCTLQVTCTAMCTFLPLQGGQSPAAAEGAGAGCSRSLLAGVPVLRTPGRAVVLCRVACELYGSHIACRLACKWVQEGQHNVTEVKCSELASAIIAHVQWEKLRSERKRACGVVGSGCHGIGSRTCRHSHYAERSSYSTHFRSTDRVIDLINVPAFEARALLYAEQGRTRVCDRASG